MSIIGGSAGRFSGGHFRIFDRRSPILPPSPRIPRRLEEFLGKSPPLCRVGVELILRADSGCRLELDVESARSTGAG